MFNRQSQSWVSRAVSRLLVCLIVFLPVLAIGAPVSHQADQSGAYIVQAAEADHAAEAVKRVGGQLTHDLGIIQAVGARLNQTQVETSKRHSGG